MKKKPHIFINNQDKLLDLKKKPLIPSCFTCIFPDQRKQREISQAQLTSLFIRHSGSQEFTLIIYMNIKGKLYVIQPFPY